MDVRCKKSGFTIVELLTVLVIIALLTGLLVPALTMVRNFAKETKQKAQFATIGQALTAFRSDYGDYPPSGPRDEQGIVNAHYCGAQKLSEALLGWDLLGFHPDSAWRADGLDASEGLLTYDPPNPSDASLDERVGSYLELATANVFELGFLFADTTPLTNRFVLCDSFGVKKITIEEKTFKAGTPILYYRANTSKNTIDSGGPQDRIYNCFDNIDLISLGRITDSRPHQLGDHSGMYQRFYDFITDPKVTARDWPYRADSYILISAGVDGEYGTRDDITNFGN